MALKPDSYASPAASHHAAQVGKDRPPRSAAWGPSAKVRPRGRVERPLVQILVGVAIIQVRVLKTEEEKGSV